MYTRRREEGDLEAQRAALQQLLSRLSSVEGPSHLVPFLHWELTPRAAYLARPYLEHSLRSRLGARPFITQAEKDAIAWQMVRAVQQAHAAGVVHGDLKLVRMGQCRCCHCAAATEQRAPTPPPPPKPGEFLGNLLGPCPAGRL